MRSVQLTQDFLTSSQGDEVPFWALSWGPVEATVHSRTAKVFEKLRDWRRAEDAYAAAATGRPTETYARIYALDLVSQAAMQHTQGHIEQACATVASGAGQHGRGAVVRTRKAVVSMRKSLGAFRARGVRSAQELDERTAVFLAA